ncbi:MAG: hypothetical protein M1828_006309 [Chrysothrix sp. TS-e1954]|nr:MAG: hypothetical protein M1828_006309 [Chrysothrix sp. TS-e1954]
MSRYERAQREWEDSLQLPGCFLKAKIISAQDLFGHEAMQSHGDDDDEDEEPIGKVSEGWDSLPPQPELPDAEKPFPDQGYGAVRDLIEKLESSDVPCCVIDAAALNYYGCPFVLSDFRICVPTLDFEEAVNIVSTETAGVYERLPRKDTWDPTDPVVAFARFRRTDRKLEVFIAAALSTHLDVVFKTPDSILVSEQSGLPFPRLKHFVQSALDSGENSLADQLVDGMNLTEEWGVRVGLRFGHVTLRNNIRLDQHEYWHWLVTSKQKRMGYKYDPKVFASRYRRHREGDLTKILET